MAETEASLLLRSAWEDADVAGVGILSNVDGNSEAALDGLLR